MIKTDSSESLRLTPRQDLQILPRFGASCSTLPPPTQDVVLFSAAKRTKAQREREGPLVRPAGWSFPQTFVAMTNMLAGRVNMANGSEYIVRVAMRNLYEAYLKDHAQKPIVKPVEVTISGSHQGQPVETMVKSLLGPGQILQQWCQVIDDAEDSLQISLYDFDNIDVPGGRGIGGADINEYWLWQQMVMTKLIDKAREFKQNGGHRKIQIILDASKEGKYNHYGFVRHNINNEGMVDYLNTLAKEEGLPIEVVPFPRELATLYHLKVLLADAANPKKAKAIVGGMNMSNHSAANWDACVLLQGAAVANLQAETFNQDWVVAKTFNQLRQSYESRRALNALKRITPSDYRAYQEELPAAQPVDNPGIRIMNTMPAEYRYFGFQPREEIGDYLKAAFNNPSLKKLLAEQFVFTHKALTQVLLKRLNEGTLDARMLHSLGVVSQFPYTRRAVHLLQELGGDYLLRYYNERKDTGEQLHAKLMMLQYQQSQTKQDEWEVFIGSSNTSKAGLETNIQSGRRRDYPNRDELYGRGNREVALAIPSNALAKPFVDQFDIDWEYSELKKPTLHGSADYSSGVLAAVPPPSPEALQAAVDNIQPGTLRVIPPNSGDPF